NGVVATQIQLATWTVDGSGNLTTADTAATMPGTKVTRPLAMKISPSGTLLAVGGVGGLQVFHFNGASAITAYSDLLTTDSIEHVAGITRTIFTRRRFRGRLPAQTRASC